jgi:uncharacterized glyoxalase superfamily protein PhnB
MPADPLDALHGPDARVAPDPVFAVSLRERLLALLDLDPSTTPGGTMPTTTVTHRGVRPYLTVVGADAAIEFYEAAFGAELVGGVYRDRDGRVGHADLDLEGGGFSLADAYPEWGNVAPDPAAGHSVSLQLEVADADATVARAVAAGATVVRPAEDQPYGARAATILDPFGHRWSIRGPLASPMTDDEVRRAMSDIGVDFEPRDPDR